MAISLFGSRRGRGGRGANLRLTEAPSQELLGTLSNRSVLARLGLGLIAILAVIAGVQAWQPAFPYRLGQRPAAGVAAIVDFQIVNRERTNRARERAAEQVPPVFRRDDRALARLAQELRAGLAAFAQADDLGKLPVEIRRGFGLSSDPAHAPSVAMQGIDRAESFARLKSLAGNEQQLRDVLMAFGRFIQPIEQNGLLRAEHLPPDHTPGGQIAIRERAGDLRVVNLAEVQLQPLLAASGALHSRWGLFPPLLPYRYEFEHWLAVQSPETLFFDAEATQQARQAARVAEPEVRDVFTAGNMLVKPGESIDEQNLEILQHEYRHIDSLVSLQERIVRCAVVFLMLLILAGLMSYHFIHHERKLVASLSSLSLYLLLFAGAVALSYALSFDPWRAEVAPVLVAVMICAVVFNPVLATLTAFSLSLIVIGATGSDLGRFTMMMGVCATAAILLANVPSRSTLVVVGLWSAIVCFVVTWATAALEGQTLLPLWSDREQWFQSLRSAGWCLASGFLVSGSLPFIESAFGAVTDISLLELGDVSHPLLQELVRRAPGTYNHSIAVASIGETAADAIGANGLLVRVGAYFHDIGKMLKPHYFVENAVPGENRHEHLAPAMSTLIIIGHVKDGADLARQHNLPQALVDFIEQHHGTTLVEFFYYEAARQAEEQPDHRTDAQESHFRYPGPKPQTREAAVMMIADAVEGASRALSEPTPSRIERLVHDIALKRLLDGQFDECGLTMTELARIEESLTKSLSAMYHGRVKYPEQRSA